MKLKIGDPITVVLLAPDPYELIDARVTYLDDYAPNPRWEWQTVGLTEQRVGTVYGRNERGTIRGVVSFRVVDHFGPRGGSVKRRDEGRTWLRGWEGLDVEALRATFLLVRSAS